MSDQTGKKLAFIVGHYKSGSTWLAHLLSIYPGIIGVRETHTFRYVRENSTLEDASRMLFNTSAWSGEGTKGFPLYWLGKLSQGIRVRTGLASGTAALSSADVPTSLHDLGFINQLRLRKILSGASSADEYCSAFFSYLTTVLAPKHYLLEKTPTNIFYVEDIRRICPDSKLMSIHRDGRDVVVSDKHHLSRTNRSLHSFEERIKKWKLAIETELEQASQYNVYQLSYEDLHVQPEKATKALLEFLGLEFDQATIARMIAGASFESMSGGRTAGQEDTSKFHRKGVIGDWRNVFSDEEIATFSELAGELLVRLGYESSPSWKNWA